MSTAEPMKSPAADTSFFSEDELAAIRHGMMHYEQPRAACIDALKVVQATHGWVPDAAIPAIASLLGITEADVESVATFYSMIFRQPVGRHVIKICDSIACYLTGYEEVIAAVRDATGLDWGQTSEDGRFTLLPVCCLGNCDKAPSLMIDDDTWGPVAPDDIAALLERYR